MDSATGGSGTSDRAYYLVEYILVYTKYKIKYQKRRLSKRKSSFLIFSQIRYLAVGVNWYIALLFIKTL